MSKSEKKPIYFPAISQGLSQQFRKSDKVINDISVNITKSIRFYNKCNNYFYYPYALFNASEHHRIKDIRKVTSMDKNCLVMCDSGGFQIGMGVTKDDHRFNYEI